MELQSVPKSKQDRVAADKRKRTNRALVELSQAIQAELEVTMSAQKELALGNAPRWSLTTGPAGIATAFQYHSLLMERQARFERGKNVLLKMFYVGSCRAEFECNGYRKC
jgi:hypothetical protein